LAGSTDHATGAFSTATAAIIDIISQINARAGTLGLSGGAVEYTLAVRAELTGDAFVTTGSTVIEIGVEIAADTGAIG
jgi:hypothetical protein